MEATIPRVTYANVDVDMTPLHRHLDGLLAGFEQHVLRRDWQAPFATGPLAAVGSPIDDGLVLGRFPGSTPEDVGRAIGSARAAARSWKHCSLDDRLEFAARWRNILSQERYHLALASLYEVGKSRIEAMGEVEEAIDIVGYYAGEMRRNGGYANSLTQLTQGETVGSRLRPYGVFAVIAPFNFPIALAVGMITASILTGNTVVFKPSPGSALTGLLIAETLKKAGLPDGVFNLVLGDDDIGRILATDDRLDGLAFTGSHAAGMTMLRHMASLRYAKPVIAEMGGKNSAFVTRSADLACAVQGVARSAFGLQGQKCSASSVVYVDNSLKSDFIAGLQAAAAEMVVGDPRRAETFMGPLHDDAALHRFETAVADAKRAGKLHFGGHLLGNGFAERYVVPTLVEVDAPGRLTREELFLPFLVLRGMDDLGAAIAEANAADYGLTAGIYTRDESELQYFLDHAEAGVVFANRASGATTGSWPGSQSFCGWKGSGMTGKGALGPWFLPQFMREQSRTIIVQA